MRCVLVVMVVMVGMAGCSFTSHQPVRPAPVVTMNDVRTHPFWKVKPTPHQLEVFIARATDDGRRSPLCIDDCGLVWDGFADIEPLHSDRYYVIPPRLDRDRVLAAMKSRMDAALAEKAYDAKYGR